MASFARVFTLFLHVVLLVAARRYPVNHLSSNGPQATLSAVGPESAKGAAVPSAGKSTAAEASWPQNVAAAIQAPSGHASPVAEASVLADVVGDMPSTTSGFLMITLVVAGFALVSIVKSLCMLSSALSQVRPREIRICMAKADPYLPILFGGCQGFYYGLFAFLLTGRSSFLILVQTNLFLVGFGTYYTSTRMCYLSFVYGFVLLQGLVLAAFPLERAFLLAGAVVSCCSFLGTIAALVTVYSVVETKNSGPIPGPIVVASLFSGIVWCVYGWILDDPLLMGPSAVTVLASGMCIYLKSLFPDGGAGRASSQIEHQMFDGASKAFEATPLAQECVTAKPRSTIGAPQEMDEDDLAEDSDFSQDALDDDDCGSTGGTW